MENRLFDVVPGFVHRKGVSALTPQPAAQSAALDNLDIPPSADEVPHLPHRV